mmetsp:Transcript_3725/g.6515  ORF Transcript_3725/g.6515 Transcript_3725/m.6515 type:complete len:206 (-) Transcript_3725:48-665(-)
MSEFQDGGYAANGSVSKEVMGSGSEESGVVPTAAGTLAMVTNYLPSSESLKEKFGEIWSRSRPWNEFANTSQMKLNTNPTELKDRMIENFQYFFYNYLVVLIVLSILTILTSPLSILGGFFILAAYVYLFIMNAEPIPVAGYEIDNKGKMVLVVLFSLIVLWITGAGATFTGLLFTMGIVSSIHAALRKSSNEVDFDTAYEPVNI